MGVDIYGIKPLSPEPLLTEDATPEQVRIAAEVRERWKQDTPGAYFANNWWHWRPIQMLIHVFNEAYNIGIPMDQIDALNSNSGHGIESPEHCQRLAQCFEEFINDMDSRGKRAVYMNTGLWADEKGRPATDKDLAELTSLEMGILYDPVTVGDRHYTPYHATDIDNLKHFAEFLMNCNGFNVY